jgi:hypothetical protein
MSRRSTIGFDRRIDIEWLDAVAGKVAAGSSAEEVREFLWTLLDGAVTGDKVNSARGKTVTVLSHIWSQVPAQAVGLRDRALGLLSDVGAGDRLALHWAMVLGTYPLMVDVADAIGRLLALQGNVALSQLTRRLVETWGERSTMIRAVQRVVRSMVQWGVLADTDDLGIYVASGTPRRVAAPVAELLVEALLLDTDHQVMPVDQLVGNPALFPFKLELNGHQLRQASQFQVHRQGVDVDVVALAADQRNDRQATRGSQL